MARARGRRSQAAPAGHMGLDRTAARLPGVGHKRWDTMPVYGPAVTPSRDVLRP